MCRKLVTVDHSCVNGVAQMAGLAAITGPMDEVRRMAAGVCPSAATSWWTASTACRESAAACRAGRSMPSRMSGAPVSGRANSPAGYWTRRTWRSFRAKASATTAAVSSGCPMRRAPSEIEEALGRMAKFLAEHSQPAA
jgi:hypothetical protein